jgi:hypothetical protein
MIDLLDDRSMNVDVALALDRLRPKLRIDSIYAIQQLGKIIDVASVLRDYALGLLARLMRGDAFANHVSDKVKLWAFGVAASEQATEQNDRERSVGRSGVAAISASEHADDCFGQQRSSKMKSPRVG